MEMPLRKMGKKKKNPRAIGNNPPLPPVQPGGVAAEQPESEARYLIVPTDKQCPLRHHMAGVTYCTHDKGPTICGGFDRNCPLKKSKNKA